MRLLFLTPVFCALVKFVMAPKLSLWVRTVPPAMLPVLAMMAAIPLVCGLTLSGFGPIWHAATMMAALLLVCGLALAGLGPIWIAATLLTLMGLALAQEDVDVPGAVSVVDAALCETAYVDALGAAAPVALDGEMVGVVDVPGTTSMVDAALCETAFMDALFGAAAGEVVGTVAVFTAGFLVPDLKDHSSRVFDSLSADHLCSPVSSMHNSGTWYLPAAIACAFCFQSLLAALLVACFFVPGLLSKGMEKDGCEKRKIYSSFLPGRDLPQASCLIRVEGQTALASAELEEGHESFNNIIAWDDVRDAVVTESPEYQCAAAAFEGTGSIVHSGPWEAQHKVQPVQFFVKGKVGVSTSVVRGCLEEVLSQVVGTDGLDVYVMMNGKILDLCSTLKSCGITDGCTVHVHFRLRGGSREDVPGQWTCSHCFATRCWPVRKRCYRCGEARDDVPVSAKVKGNGKADVTTGPLGRKPPQTASSVPPTTRRPQVVPPRGPPGAGVGSPPTPESPPTPPPEELVKALQLLQSILTPEDFSKYEKKLGPPKQQERVKLRERELLEAVERQANYEKQEQKHLEMIEKHEHNLAQQKKMLESVRSQLAEVRDTVGALRALVSETKEPPINSIVPPLPPPREPPPPLVTGDVLPTLGRAQDFLPLDSSYTQIDLDTDMEDEPGLTQSKSNKKRVLMKLKGSSSSGRRETVKYEASSGKDLARALAKLSPGGMNEFVQSVPVNVAGFLMRSAAQSAPLRLWPTEIDSQDADNIRGGPAAIEACG